MTLKGRKGKKEEEEEYAKKLKSKVNWAGSIFLGNTAYPEQEF